jgi:hypothetical protein
MSYQLATRWFVILATFKAGFERNEQVNCFVYESYEFTTVSFRAFIGLALLYVTCIK